MRIDGIPLDVFGKDLMQLPEQRERRPERTGNITDRREVATSYKDPQQRHGGRDHRHPENGPSRDKMQHGWTVVSAVNGE